MLVNLENNEDGENWLEESRDWVKFDVSAAWQTDAGMPDTGVVRLLILAPRISPLDAPSISTGHPSRIYSTVHTVAVRAPRYMTPTASVRDGYG